MINCLHNLAGRWPIHSLPLASFPLDYNPLHLHRRMENKNMHLLNLIVVIGFVLAAVKINAHPLQEDDGSNTNMLKPKQGDVLDATNFYVPVLYDTLIHGGQVIHTETGTVQQADIGIVDGKIAAISTTPINTAQALNVINAFGHYVTPGLVDLHTHVYHGSTYWGLDPEPIAAITGVTTWVDAGSSGAYNFPAFKQHIIDRSSVRIFAFIHISGIGLTGRTFESSVVDYLDTEMTNVTIQQNPSVIKGIKVRMDRESTNGTGLLALEKAIEVAGFNNVPVMTHIGFAPPDITDIIGLMRSNDILTHAFSGHTNRLIDDSGNPLPVVQTILDKNIVLDVGHGGGSFSYITAEGLIRANIWPDVISSDIHQSSRLGPMFDLPTTISKFINLGMPLVDAIVKSTIVPARIIKEDNNIGVLKVGLPADIAIFRLEDGDFTFSDPHEEERQGRYKLTNTLTMVNGKVLERKKESGPSSWILRDLDLISGRRAKTVHNEL